MLDNLNNVIERQALLSHHVTLLFAASLTGVVPLPGREVPSSTSTHFIFVKCKAECKPFGGLTSVFKFSVYSCEMSQREDRRVGLMNSTIYVGDYGRQTDTRLSKGRT